MTPKYRAVQRDIAELLGENIFRRRMARRIGACDAEECNKCGSVCPGRAARWYEGQLPRMKQLFCGTSDHEIHRLRLLRSTWACDRGNLVDASLGAISKTLRRTLDNLHEPSI